MGQAIQFRNKATVLKAFENRGVEAWGLFQSKQFLFKGIGIDELETVLNALSEGGTNAIYTLKVYEEVEDPAAIKSNLPDDGSFNFRLDGDNMELTISARTGYINFDSRLQAIEDAIAAINDKDGEDIVVTEKESVIGEILGNPAIAALIPILVEKLMAYLTKEKPKPAAPSADQGAAISARPIVLNGVPDLITQLKFFDPEIEKHLEKLLLVAQKNGPFFKMLIKTLEDLVV